MHFKVKVMNKYNAVSQCEENKKIGRQPQNWLANKPVLAIMRRFLRSKTGRPIRGLLFYVHLLLVE
jgi:hypothetical protein